MFVTVSKMSLCTHKIRQKCLIECEHFPFWFVSVSENKHDKLCAFPLKYEGTWFFDCRLDGVRAWCSLDTVYNGTWGYCKTVDTSHCPAGESHKANKIVTHLIFCWWLRLKYGFFMFGS